MAGAIAAKKPSYVQETGIEIFKNPQMAEAAWDCVSSDRLWDGKTIVQFLEKHMERAQDKVESTPFLQLLWLLVKGDKIGLDKLKQAAFDHAKSTPKDRRFEACLVNFNPVIALRAHVVHWLITSGKIKCANPDNNDFYDEQLMGATVNTNALDAGNTVTESQFSQYKKLEGQGYKHSIQSKVDEMQDGHSLTSKLYPVKAWYSTPQQADRKDLFREERLKEQDVALEQFSKALVTSSPSVKTVMGFTASGVVILTGAYAVGKTTLAKQLFGPSHVSINVENVQEFLKEGELTPWHWHWEGSALKPDLIKLTSEKSQEIECVAMETADVELWRLTQTVKRYSSKEEITVYVLATLDPYECVRRMERSGKPIASDVVLKSANDAKKNTPEILDWLKTQEKVRAILCLSTSDDNGKPSFIEIAKIQKGKEPDIMPKQETVYQQLTQT